VFSPRARRTRLEPWCWTCPRGKSRRATNSKQWIPANCPFTVNVTAPIGAVVDVTFLTADGATLHVFETPSNPEEADCVEEAVGFLDCRTDFPLLEVREPGTWTASVHKTSSSSRESLNSTAPGRDARRAGRRGLHTARHRARPSYTQWRSVAGHLADQGSHPREPVC
jgi:hypothetical protein